MEAALWPTLADAVSLLAERGLRSALIGGLAVSLPGLVASRQGTIDWQACLTLAERLGGAIDVDIAARLRAARSERD